MLTLKFDLELEFVFFIRLFLLYILYIVDAAKPSSNTIIIAVTVVACTCLLIAAIIIVAVVFFTKMRKSLLNAGTNNPLQIQNGDGNAHSYENIAVLYESEAGRTKNEESPSYVNADMVGTGLYEIPGPVSPKEMEPSVYETFH